MSLPVQGLSVNEACHAALDHVATMVRVSSPADGVTYVNKAWRELTGSSLADNTGSGWLRFVHPDDRAAVSSGAPGTVTYRLVTREGDVTVLDSGSTWMGDSGQDATSVHTITLQPTPQPSPTMSKWAHELRGPLNAILGWADLLSTGDAGADVLDRGLKAIASNARQQAQIIKRMTE